MTDEERHAVEGGETESQEQSRRKFLGTAGAAAVGLVAAGTVAYVGMQRAVTTDTLASGYHAGDLPLDDPLASVWTRRSVYVAKMVAQNITTPVQQTVEVPELRVRSLHNGKQIAFHLEWVDTSEDDTESIATFRDAVAVQFEVDPKAAPSFTMGNPDGPVHILLWRASWQTDVDHGHQGIAQLFPNAYNDVTPEKLMPQTAATTFYPARVAGNSQANHERTSPVEELTAIGFGSLTTHDTQNAVGKGVHNGRRWHVILAMPMDGGDKTKATIAPGETRNVAFAVWDGGKGQRGARKQYFPWVSVEVEAAG